MYVTRATKPVRHALATLLALGSSALLPAMAQNPPAVPTQNNDNARTGANLSETILTPANVTVSKFGKLFTRTLDANVNGQVLYVPSLSIQGVNHNVIFAFTSNNANNSPCSVYAFDADSPTASNPLWRHQFTNSAQWNTCTPVIDTANKILYVLTKDNNDNGPTNLHALDLTSGNELPGSPITIAASVPGTGDGSVNGVVSFDTSHANCRPGLLLLNGVVYFAFAHNTDSFPYHGWVFGYSYNGAKFTQTAVFNTCPNGGLSGIWQAGKGLAADNAGNIYCSVGNGTFDVNTGGTSYGMCYLKLSTPNLTVVDWFAPFDEQALSNSDLDLGNSGPLGIPGTNRLFAGGTKFGSAFLLDSTNMGHFTSGGPDKCLQRLDGVSNNDNVGQNPIVWDAGATKYIYLWPNGFQLEQFFYDTTVNQLNPAGIWKTSSNASAGGSLAISANGSSNGILWAVGADGVVRAFDATNVSNAELWDSSQNSNRDGLGSVGHFQFPTVVNGKVYVPTGSGSIVAYGLLPTNNPTTLNPVADSYVRAGTYYGNDNFGSATSLIVETAAHNNTNTSNRAAYLKFDLTQVTTAPAKATLTLTVNSGSFPYGGTETVNLYDIANTAWTESGITYNNAPGLNGSTFTSTGTLLTTLNAPLKIGTISIDLTAYVTAHLGQMVTLQLIDPNVESKALYINSKEAASGKPTLTLQ
ncbi:MAG TPA: DNRLRE domain-containing protein [Chthonomonadaceae bacterium]|nr:DNRLRE domain-containing protein [Chthonomonadaceae bacterium]